MASPEVTYSGSSRGHSIVAVDTAESRVTLEDGSVWIAYEGYVDVLRGWGEGEMITVKENRDELFPYKLINVHHNQSVEVRLLPADR
ncbi:MAG: hypothetical protein P8X48_11285 [Acidiferrobacteraceae bacterium]|jgi:hypothetical protein